MPLKQYKKCHNNGELIGNRIKKLSKNRHFISAARKIAIKLIGKRNHHVAQKHRESPYGHTTLSGGRGNRASQQLCEKQPYWYQHHTGTGYDICQRPHFFRHEKSPNYLFFSPTISPIIS